MPQTGLDMCIREEFSRFQGMRVALVCNQASVAQDFSHVLDHFARLHSSGFLTVERVFGPQHGIWGHTQDNMVEWEGYTDSRTGLQFTSLYGERRKPAREHIERLDTLVFDVPDVGARYYTFIWTLAHCMAACSEAGVPVTVLDRPNPINGIQIEGPVLEPGFESFVGLHSIPIRHGMTVGELALHFKERFYPNVELHVVKLEEWKRSDFGDKSGFTWVPPSPNMPTVDTAAVYPGQCLLEGTNLSEGRGTTRPFETFGAPWLDGWQLTTRLNRLDLPGVWFRPVQFQPTFQKHNGQICQGAFLHVTDRSRYRSVLTTVAMLQVVSNEYPDQFRWKEPPYEYETVRLPIDVLAGNSWLRELVDSPKPLNETVKLLDRGTEPFERIRQAHLLY